MYRGRLWTMRQYAGFGTASETNTRFRQLLDAGQTGLSVAFDLPTQMGIDSDSPRAVGEVGRVGVAIDTVDDMHTLLEGIPLDRVSTSMTINATAATLLAMYIVVAEERGFARSTVSGTIQNDILKEYLARGTYIYPPGPSLRLITDTFRFCAAEVPQWNPISISGYHIREAGATAVQELAFTLSNTIEYVKGAIEGGLAVDRTYRPVRGGGQVPRRAPHLRAADARTIRRVGRELPAPLSHPDRRRHAHGAVAAQQRRACHDPGAGGGVRWDAITPYQRVRRGAFTTDARSGDAGPSHAADCRL
jgi:hypothetical protein